MRHVLFVIAILACSTAHADWIYSYGSGGRYAQTYTYRNGMSQTWTNGGGYYNSYTPGYYGGYRPYSAPVYQGYSLPTQYNPPGWYGLMGSGW